jgi:hypothetical protein
MRESGYANNHTITRVVAWLCKASSPPLSLGSICQHPYPGKGRGQSWRYLGKGASGRVNPCASSLFRLAPYAGPWEASPLGEGQTGRGQKAPSPVSGFNMPASLSPGRGAPEKPEDHPPRISALNMPASPTPPGLRPPPPPRGPGAVVAIPGEGRTRGVSPYAGPWEVSPRGEGQTGRGQKAPSPVSAFNVLASPTPPGLRPPPPPRGAGAVVAIPGGRPYPGERTPAPAPSSDSPHTLDRGRHPHGGWGRRGGGKKPPPLSLLSICRHPLPRAEGHQRSQRTTPRGSLLSIYRHPPPRPASGLLPRPGRAEGSRGDTRGKAVPGAYPHTLDRGRISPRGWGRRGGGKEPPPLSLLSIC